MKILWGKVCGSCGHIWATHVKYSKPVPCSHGCGCTEFKE